MNKSLSLIVITLCLFFAFGCEKKAIETGQQLTPVALPPQQEYTGNSVANVEPLPEKFLLPVPFTSQAPFANWGEPYQEACEEASSLMAAEYFRGNGQKALDKAYADAQIVQVVEWEKSYFGWYDHTDTAQTAEMLEKHFHLQAEVVTDVTSDRIKQELFSGKLILVPTAGRELGNPYYSGAGPLYHMLVVRGWDQDFFITNDPGTRRGKEFKYQYQTLLDAVHDWNGGDIYNSTPMMIVVSLQSESEKKFRLEE